MSDFNVTAYLGQPTPWQNRPQTIRGVIISLATFSLICVALRLYIRLAVVAKPGWDDLFVGLYLAATLVSAVSISIAPSFGLGEHLFLFTPSELRNFLLLFYTANASYISATAFIKLSLLLQYLRLFTPGTVVYKACQVLVVIVALWGFVFSFMAWVPCFPVHKYWDFTEPSGSCYGFGISTDRAAFIAHTSTNMMFDTFVLALPMPLVLKASTSLRTRVGMVCLTVLGCLVNVFAAWRLALVVRSSDSPLEIYIDSTFYAPDTALLSALEVNLASVCASVPIFWPVLRQQMFRILVTKEVSVTHDDRYHYKLDSRGDDSITKTADSNSVDESRRHSRSQGGVLVAPGPGLPGSETNGNYYADDFVMDQVFPFRDGASARVETFVSSNPSRAAKGQWEGLSLG